MESCFGPVLFQRGSDRRGVLEYTVVLHIVLQNDLISQLERIGEGKPLWFVHGGALLHYATIVQNWLNGNFENWIGQRGTVERTPSSPDLTPMDFYFGGHLKQLVYSTRIADVGHLTSR